MDSVKQHRPNVAQKNRLARTFAKILHFRAATGVTPVDGIQRLKPQKESIKNLSSSDNQPGPASQSIKDHIDVVKSRERAAIESLLAKLFASLSSIKAAYAQLQFAQTPYDADGIQLADQIVVSELKSLSELKQCYLKKQFDPSPGKTLALAEIQEHKSLVKSYEILAKKLDSLAKFKASEITMLREKLYECNKRNRSIDKKLNSSNGLSTLDNLSLSDITPSHFIMVRRTTIKTIRSFVKVMVYEMLSAGWDIEKAVSAIVPGLSFRNRNHKCFAFESFVCKKMFEDFQSPIFTAAGKSCLDKSKQKQLLFEEFLQLKSTNAVKFATRNPISAFARFLRVKFRCLVHPKMELSFFRDTNHTRLLKAGGFPDTAFFTAFVEMAKHVWLLHCLAFSFEPEATIFQVRKNCRFSEVYMESVADDEAFSQQEPLQESDQRVAFTVLPGFKIGKIVVQSLASDENEMFMSNGIYVLVAFHSHIDETISQMLSCGRGGMDESSLETWLESV